MANMRKYGYYKPVKKILPVKRKPGKKFPGTQKEVGNHAKALGKPVGL